MRNRSGDFIKTLVRLLLLPRTKTISIFIYGEYVDRETILKNVKKYDITDLFNIELNKLKVRDKPKRKNTWYVKKTKSNALESTQKNHKFHKKIIHYTKM